MHNHPRLSTRVTAHATDTDLRCRDEPVGIDFNDENYVDQNSVDTSFTDRYFDLYKQTFSDIKIIRRPKLRRYRRDRLAC